MQDSSAGERPLDPDETRALQGIERELRAEDPDLPRRLLSAPGVFHPPVRQTGTPISAWVVVGVLVAVVLFTALLVLLLPEWLIVPVVLVTMFGLTPACCLLWARRSGEL